MSVASLRAMQRGKPWVYLREQSLVRAGGREQQAAHLARLAVNPVATGLAKRCMKGPGQARLGSQTKASTLAVA